MEHLEFITRGDSMQGLIRDGDKLSATIFPEPRSLKNCKCGDVVLLKVDNEWVVHRIVSRNGFLSTKGDHNAIFDQNTDPYVWGRINGVVAGGTVWSWPFRNSFLKQSLTFLSRRNSLEQNRFIRAGCRNVLLLISFLSRKTLRTTYNSTLFELEFSSLQKVARNHGIEPFLYTRIPDELKDKVSRWKQLRIEESLKNTVILQELRTWSHSFSGNVNPVLLKGVALLGRVYPELGDRKLSDIDLLVSEDEKFKLEETLIARGFKKSNEDHGKANKSKTIWTRHAQGLELVVELHTKLNWFEPKSLNWNTIASKIDGYQQLDPIDELIYLSIHLVYSHNFQRLHWLIDIFLLLRKNEDSIDREKLKQRANELRAEKALAAVYFALEKIFGYQVPNWEYKKKFLHLKPLISRKFLYEPYHSVFYYALMKHLLQDRILNSFLYDFYRLQLEIQRNWIQK